MLGHAGRWRLRARPWGPDLAPAMALRAALFRGGADDRDAFDAGATHLTVEDADGRVAAYARAAVQRGAEMGRGYAARFYDLAPLARAFPAAVEVGRVCTGDAGPEPARLLLAGLAALVEREGVAVLYGCASFPGTAPPAALGRLAQHVAHPWGPRRRAAETVPIPSGGTGPLPPMLRLYLSLGAGVSDHAVIDRDLGTVHVLVGLPVAAIPPARARALRGLLAPA